jgi:ABC-type transport system involved in multi-copper enzyme maturation permease subunit
VNVGTINPVLDRELRQRSRSARSMFLLTIFLGLLIGVMFLAYKATETTAGFAADPVSALTVQVGRSMFEWVLAAELVILLFIIPGISAGSIAGERDRQTLIPLQVTLVGPIGIFIGKVLASSSFILLLLIASAPVLAVPYLVGGISLSQVLLSLLSLLCIGFLMATMGVACSAVFRRTQTATLAAYAMVLVLTLGTVVGLAVLAVIDGSRGTDTIEPRLIALYPNPFLTVTDAAGDIASPSSGPFSPLKQVFIESQVGPGVIVEGGVAFNPETGNQAELPAGIGGLPLWVRSLLVQAGLAVVLAIVGIRRLRSPSRELQT